MMTYLRMKALPYADCALYGRPVHGISAKKIHHWVLSALLHHCRMHEADDMNDDHVPLGLCSGMFYE